MFHFWTSSPKLSAFAFCTLVIPALCGQETVYNASVSGRVVDPSGAVVGSARVVARQTETGVSVSTETDRDGRFRFPYLKVGPYEIAVRCPGFADVTERLTLRVGAAYT